MKNRKFKRGVLVVLLGFFVACSGVKETAKQETKAPEGADAAQEAQIKEQNQKKFEYLFVEALKEKALGNTQKAIQLLSGCLEIDSESSAAMYELAGIHAGNNDFTSASLLLEKAISLHPENKWYRLLLARIYQQTEKYTEAAREYDRLIEKDPENLEYLYTKAALLANAEKYEEAIQAYDLLEEKTGINEQISVAKQQLYVSMGETEKAFQEIEKLIKKDPDETKYYGLMADLFQSVGDSVNALKFYRKIQEIDPENGFVHFSLANYYLEKGDFQKSFEETKKGFESEEVDIQTKLQLYMMLTARPEKSKLTPEQEDGLIDILLKTHPGEYLVHTVRAESLMKKGKLGEARDELLKALEMEKNDYMLWERVLFIDNDLQEWNALYKHSRKAMDLFPNQPQTYFLNAVACLQLEKFDETVSVSEEGLMYVVENVQMEARFLMLKGEALYKLGKLEQAFALFDESVELDNDNYIALNNYAYYLSLAGKNLDKAERLSGRVIERFPDNPTYLDTYAWVLFKKGEYSLAKFYMESALKSEDQKSATLLEHYGDILFKLQKNEEALKYWKKARELGEGSELLDRKISEKKYIEE